MVTWDSESLKKIVQQSVVHSLNCHEGEVWSAVFPEGAFARMHRHTTGKPREIIRLSCLAIDTARGNGRKRSEDEDVQQALRTFSQEKIEELGTEWGHRYRAIELLVRR